MSKTNTHVKRGQFVQVISGEHKGKSGVILQVVPSKNQVIVEGVRMITKAVRKSQERPEGGLIQREGPIHISNVKLAATTEEKPRTGKSRKA
jgi:large subunit ribosomal protein L24